VPSSTGDMVTKFNWTESGYVAHDKILDELREAYERERNGNGSEIRCGWTRGCAREPRNDIHSMSVESGGLAGGRERLKYLIGDGSEQGGNIWLLNVITRL